MAARNSTTSVRSRRSATSAGIQKNRGNGTARAVVHPYGAMPACDAGLTSSDDGRPATPHTIADLPETATLCVQPDAPYMEGFGDIVGKSPAMQHTMTQLDRVAPTDATVLLFGETGTGKDLLARAIHARSQRKDRPFVAINCAALPSALIEAELFGHEKGAFTGAVGLHLGRFEVADSGTLLLDEVGELPLELQAKLLRVLQEGTFERVGSSRTLRVDVRILAATNRNLQEAISAGRFRADLYYRLNVFPIHVPPLRDRRVDIPLLVWYAISQRQRRLGRNIQQIPEDTMQALTAYNWPGNVRELENVIEHAMIISNGPVLTLDAPFVQQRVAPGPFHLSLTLEEVERNHIQAVLEDCGWKVKGQGNAADRLGLKASTLFYRMKALGITRPQKTG